VNDGEFRPTAQALTFLLSAAGRALLSELAAQPVNDATRLAHTTRLRKTYPPDVAAAALELTLLRDKARAKFTHAGEMFFTRQALEQASAQIVAQHRAPRFARYPFVADLCCGIGGDALALAAHADVLAIDSDLCRLRMAAANARVYGVGDRLRVLCADAAALPLLAGLPGWADPARRRDGRRVFAPESYRPPLAALLRWAKASPGAGIKLAPGIDYAALDALLAGAPHEIEIISVQRQAREAVLWLGELVTAARRATLLPGGHTLTSRPLAERVPLTPPGRYLYEPDAAVIRAHLVEHLAQDLGATKLDDQIAYLTADTLVETPFATAYRVDEVMPFNLKRLNRRLRALDIGELIIKKRGFAVDPEQFRRRLDYGGGQRQVVLVLTRVQEQPLALLCRSAAASERPSQ